MKIDRIVVSAVSYATENVEKVASAIATIFPFEFEINRVKAKGHFGNPIEYLEVELKKRKEIKDFWNNFIKLLGDQVDQIVNTLDDRIDDEGQLFIRIDKQKAYLGDVVLTEGGDAIVIRVKLVTYPARREKLIEFAKEILIGGYR